MLDAGYEGSEFLIPESSSDRPERRQYTLKGVEAETIQLMRDAAGKEGMKIGSWVSLRMKEAAEKALAHSTDRSLQITKPPSPDTPDEIVQHLCFSINLQREEAEKRFEKMERELHEIANVQRTILTKLLTL
ncbi:MAG: hypothetical protein V3V60_09105 [Sphingomonas aquatilis]|jgi:hypothetical protein|uniref:hypothetical protein n=1 Tax=Sphingomonas aquatilis TaxID=93063 RepID=UPI0025DE02B4|nr:hypothetical protein [uncultured Sphingomonas sp.]